MHDQRILVRLFEKECWFYTYFIQSEAGFIGKAYKVYKVYNNSRNMGSITIWHK